MKQITEAWNVDTETITLIVYLGCFAAGCAIAFLLGRSSRGD